jgi:hypothetical protein
MKRRLLFAAGFLAIFWVGFSAGLTFGEDRTVKNCERHGEATFANGSIRCLPTSRD